MDHRIAQLRARLAAETPGSQVQKTRDRAQQPLGRQGQLFEPKALGTRD